MCSPPRTSITQPSEGPQFADVFLQRGSRPMIERVAPCSSVFEDLEHAAYHGLQGNRAVSSGYRDRCHETRDPVANAHGECGLFPGIRAIIV